MKIKNKSSIKAFQFFMIVRLMFPQELLNANGLITDTSAGKENQALVGKTKNGIDQVDIVAPNAKGTSHNKFTEYNVGDRGIILNNSNKLSETQLSGIVGENKNLIGKNMADLIITEVTGNNLSKILGFTEIAGKKADYVLANPNGVMLNGAGFINTSKVTISSGSILNDPDLRIKVRKGIISVGGKGINTDGVDYFNIISKVAKIQGDISSNKKSTKEIKIISGSTDYLYDKDDFNKIDEETKNEYSVGIDTSELGGLVAGKIRLISTDMGVGVNVKGKLIAEVDDIEIDSKGNVNFKTGKAKNSILIKSEGNIEQAEKKSLLVGKDIELKGKGKVNIQGEIQSKEKLNITSKDIELEGNLNSENSTISLKGNLKTEKKSKIVSKKKIEIFGDVLNEGEIVSEDFDVTSNLIENKGQIRNNKGSIKGKKLVNDGEITSIEKLDVTGNELINNKTIISKTLKINSKDVKNNGEIRTKNIEVISNNFENTKKIVSDKINLNSKNTLNNKGNIVGEEINISGEGENENSTTGYIEGKKNIKASNLLNKGSIATNFIGIKDRLTNSGKILGSEKLDIYGLETKGVEIQNNGLIGTTEKNSELNINKNILSVDNKGDLISGNIAIISQGEIVNSGEIITDKLNLSSFKIVNKKNISSEEISLVGNVISNSGDIVSKNKLKIEGELENSKLLLAEDIKITGNNLENKSQIISNGDIIIESKEQINNSGEIIGKNSVFKSKKIINNNLIKSDNLNLDSENKIENQKKGNILVRDSFKFKNLLNEGMISSSLIRFENIFNNIGKIINKNNFKIESDNEKGILVNQGIIQGEGTLQIEKLKLENNGTILGKTVELTSKDIQNNKDGKILSNGVINIKNDSKNSKLENRGIIGSESDIFIAMSNLKNTNKIYANNITVDMKNENNLIIEGIYNANKKLKINAENIDIEKTLESSGEIELNIVENLNINSDIKTLNNLGIKVKTIIMKDGTKITIGNNGKINTENNFKNNGKISAYNNLEIDVKNGDFENNGQVAVQENLDIKVGNKLINGEEKTIYAGNNIEIGAKNLDNEIGGTILTSKGDIELKVKEKIVNKAGKSLDGRILSGTIKSEGDLNITSKNLINEGFKYEDGDIGKLYTEKEIREIITLKNKLPEIKWTTDSGNGVTKYYISGWEKLTAKDFFNTNEDMKVGENYVKDSKNINWRSKELISTLLIAAKNKKDIRVKQSEIESGKNINIKLEEDFRNRGIVTSKNNIKISAKNIINETEAKRVKNVVTKVKILASAYITAQQPSANFGATPKNGYGDLNNYFNPKIVDIVTEDITLIAKDGAKIVAGNDIVLIGNVLNVDSENVKLGKDYDNIYKKSEVKVETKKQELENLTKDLNDENIEKRINQTKEKLLNEKKIIEKEKIEDIIKTMTETKKYLLNEKIKLEKEIGEKTDQDELKKLKIKKEKIEEQQKELEKNIIIQKKQLKNLLNDESIGGVRDKEIDEDVKTKEQELEKEKQKLEKKEKEKFTLDELLKKQKDLKTEDYIFEIKGDNGVFKVNKNKNKPLIETNIEFIDVKKYYASDYFFKKINYNPDKSIRKLGDAYYETTLINNIINKNFSNSLKGKKQSDILQMKSLLDNAVEESKRLPELKIGKELTSEDIDKLDKNIVWYVEKEINSEKVLVPQLYIAKKGIMGIENENQSVISGKNVKLEGNIIENIGGKITATDKLEIDANEIINKSSAKKAELNAKKTYVTATKNIKNLGSVIKGEEILSLKTEKGDIINESLKKTEKSLMNEEYKETLKDAAELKSDNKLIIDSGKDYIQKGALVKGKDVIKKVEKDIKISNLELNEVVRKEGSYKEKIVNSSDSVKTQYNLKSKNQKNVESKVIAENNLIIKSGENINVKGSSIEGNNIFVDSKKVNFEGSIDKEERDYNSKRVNGGVIKNVSDKSYTEKLNKSKISAKNNLFINATEGDLVFKGTDRSAGDLLVTKSDNGSVKDLAQQLKSTSKVKVTEMGLGAELLEVTNDLANKKNDFLNTAGMNGKNKMVTESNVGLETNVDNLKGQGFVSNTYISKYGSNGTVTSGLTYDVLTDEKESNTFIGNKVNAGSQFISAKKNIEREAFEENIDKDSVLTAKNGDILNKIVKNTVIQKTEQNIFSMGVEVGYKVPAIDLIEKIDKKVTYNEKSDFSSKNAKKSGKENIGEVADGVLSLVEVGGDLSKLAGADFVEVSGKFGISNTNINKKTKVEEGIKNKSNIGGKSEYNARKGKVSLDGIEGKAENLNIYTKNLEMNSIKNTYSNDESANNTEVNIKGSASVDKAGAGAGLQAGIETTQVLTDTVSKSNVLSSIEVKNKTDINVKENATIFGKIKSKFFNGTIGKELKIVSSQDEVKHKSMDMNANVSAGVAASSAGIIPTGSVGGSYGQVNENKKWVKEQSGIVSDEEFNLNVGEKVKLTGSLLGSTQKNKTNITTKSIETEDLKDTHVRAGGYGGVGVVLGKTGVVGGNIKGGTAETYIKNQDTKTTIGNGNIITEKEINGKINNDFDKTQETTKDFVMKKVDIDYSFSVPKKNEKDENYEEKENPLYGKRSIKEEAIYETVKDPIYNKVGDEASKIEKSNKMKGRELPKIPKANDNYEERENPLYGKNGKRSIKEEAIYETIKDPIYNKVGDEASKENNKNKVVEKVGIFKSFGIFKKIFGEKTK